MWPGVGEKIFRMVNRPKITVWAGGGLSNVTVLHMDFV